jgi:hypothetical protein
MDLLQNDKHIKQLKGWMNIDYLCRVLLSLYILTMPFVSAFAFTGTISLPLIFAVFLFTLTVLNILKSGKFPPRFLGFDILIISLLLFFDVFSFVLNGWGNSKSLSHTVAYFVSFILFYITIKLTLFFINDKKKIYRRVLQLLTYTVLFSAIFANAESILNNFFGIDVNNYIPRPNEGEEYYGALALGFLYRARGFAQESGHFTFMMELFFPVALYYMYFSGLCKWHKFFKALSVFCVFLSFIFAVSAASFIILPVSFLISAIFYMKMIFRYLRLHLTKFFIITISVTVITGILNYFFSFYTFISLSVLGKLSSGSYDDRQDRVEFFYENFSRFDLVKKLIGGGPAGFDILGYRQGYSILSLYHSIAFELGLTGLLLITLFMLYSFLNCLAIKNRIGYFLMVAFISGVLHYFIVANFWYPWFWFITSLIIFYKENCPLIVRAPKYMHDDYQS